MEEIASKKKAGMSGARLDDYEALVPCHKSLLEARGYTKIKGKWVPPKKNNEELDSLRSVPHFTRGGHG